MGVCVESLPKTLIWSKSERGTASGVEGQTSLKDLVRWPASCISASSKPSINIFARTGESLSRQHGMYSLMRLTIAWRAPPASL